MEHSLLHGLQLCGLIFALGGVLFRLLVLSPVSRALPPDQKARAEAIDSALDLWVGRAACAAALGTLVDLFVQVAEMEGQTIYTGVSLSTFFHYCTATTVGNLALLKIIMTGTAAALSRLKPKGWAVLLPLIAAAVASTLVSHSAALPRARTFAISAQLAHVFGAAFWLGMLAFLWMAARRTKATNEPGLALLGSIVGRFSGYAMASVFVIGASGLYSAFLFIVSPRAVLTSAYGLTLLLKLLLLTFVVYAGFRNWHYVRPRLLTVREADTCFRLNEYFRRLLELELSAGILLMMLAGVLGSISPPSEVGREQLSPQQTQALLSPRLPPAHFIRPEGFVGATARTDDDLRYAEFTHQWSGVFVILLGLCWAGQSILVRHGNIFSRTWPLLLIPFGCFVSIVADPEVWILRSVTLGEVFGNAQVLEHQMGAGLVFVLALLGFRDHRRKAELRPLGYVFPIVIIVGSLMLLGHAHTSFTSPELSSLINVQHAVIGGCGLMAGTLRWFQLRRLPGTGSFRYLWPGGIVLLGIFMAFFYRELTPINPNSLALR